VSARPGRESDTEPEKPSRPHTIVTYFVLKVLAALIVLVVFVGPVTYAVGGYYSSAGGVGVALLFFCYLLTDAMGSGELPILERLRALPREAGIVELAVATVVSALVGITTGICLGLLGTLEAALPPEPLWRVIDLTSLAYGFIAGFIVTSGVEMLFGTTDEERSHLSVTSVAIKNAGLALAAGFSYSAVSTLFEYKLLLVAGALAVGCVILFYLFLLRASWDWFLFVMPINQTKTFLVALLSLASGWSAGGALGVVGSIALVGIIGGRTLSLSGAFSAWGGMFFSAFPIFLTMLLGYALGRPLGGRFGGFLHRALDEFSDVVPYLRAMWWPVGGFAAGYIMMVVLFAGFFAVAQDSVGGLDGLPKGATFLDYFYFSLMTITSLGYGGVEAASAPTRLLVSLEVLIGIGWMVIVFAAVVAYLEGRFSDVRDKDHSAVEEATMQQLEQLTRERAEVEEQRNELKEQLSAVKRKHHEELEKLRKELKRSTTP
jgi:hypothetical protein